MSPRVLELPHLDLDLPGAVAILPGLFEPTAALDPGDPLDLAEEIERARVAAGARGIVDLLVEALTDRRVRRDTDIDAYLDRLKSACRQTRRYRDAIPVFERITVLNPARRHEIAAELAIVHGHLKEHATAVSLLESAFVEQRRLPARRRSLSFCVTAEVAATVLRQSTLARELAALGRSIVATPARRRSTGTRSGSARGRLALVPAA